MKINKLFVQEVANGKYREYDSHGEMQRAAQRILDEKVVSKFRVFCFRAYGKCMPDNVFDIYDAFVDFASHGAEIKVKVPTSIHPTGYWQVFGMTAKDSLYQLYHDVYDVEGLLDAVCIVKHLTYVVKTCAVAENRLIGYHISDRIIEDFSCVDRNILAAQKSEQTLDRAVENNKNSAGADTAHDEKCFQLFAAVEKKNGKNKNGKNIRTS